MTKFPFNEVQRTRDAAIKNALREAEYLRQSLAKLTDNLGADTPWPMQADVLLNCALKLNQLVREAELLGWALAQPNAEAK